jgi:hypothetical protein
VNKPCAVAVAVATVALAAPPAASAQSLAVDPVAPCYREQQTVFLTAQGYTPNGLVGFSRDGKLIEQLQADASGSISGNLTLPGLLHGQRRLTYVATDRANPALSAEVGLLTTATDVTMKPRSGVAPNRRLTIQGRGFFGGRTLWAHVVRPRGARASAARNMRIGRVRGACKKVKAKKRLFRAGTAPGSYRVQFDTFRRYKPRRLIEAEFIVTIFGTARSAAVVPRARG